MARLELDHAIEALPEMGSAIRRAYLASPDFRDLCADFALARTTLDEFERRVDAASRPEIAEYRELIRCLSADIVEWLRRIEHQTPSGVVR
jgi:hypothetical protein